MKWQIEDKIALIATAVMHDNLEEKRRVFIKTQKYYQECAERIAGDSAKVMETVINVVTKASHCYYPQEIKSGGSYLPLYCFACVIKAQGRVTSEQKALIEMYFKHVSYPFNASGFINAALSGAEIADFRKVITLNENYAGLFWTHFFRALYKAGTQNDLQDMVNYVTMIMMRFSVLGNVEKGRLSLKVCDQFIKAVNKQIKEVKTISSDEIDWLGIIPPEERLWEMRKNYELILDHSDFLDSGIPRESMIPHLDMLVLNGICDIVMMTKQPNSVKLSMAKDAVAFSKIKVDITPESYIKDIANKTDKGEEYKALYSGCTTLGKIWQLILAMGNNANMFDEALSIYNGILSILLQVESHLVETYHFLGEDHLAQKYMDKILSELLKRFS